MADPTFGIEEEFFLADARTGVLREDSPAILRRARELVTEGLDKELRTAMVEAGTAVCRDAATATAELARHRQALMRAAADCAAVVLATSTHPSARLSQTAFSDDQRYQRMAAEFGRLATEMLVCGCHVHVAVPDRAAGVAVIDRIRPWLPALLALSANSPLWAGEDTGFASWRSQVWSRWPTAGPTSPFGDLATYEQQATAVIAAGAALDRGMLYYDARLSESFPTVEIRVADVCLDPEDAVVVAVLARALVMTELRAADRPATPASVELLRAANFMAARRGVTGDLLDVTDQAPKPAAVVLRRLLDHLDDALRQTGDRDLAQSGVERLVSDGTGASRQRAAWQAGGEAAVLDLVTLR